MERDPGRLTYKIEEAAKLLGVVATKHMRQQSAAIFRRSRLASGCWFQKRR